MLGILFVLATPRAIYSCGPFLESAIFAFDDQPDGPAEDFAAGKLGIVRPGFRDSYLVVAYRYFSGLELTREQQEAAIGVWNRNVVPSHPSEVEAVQYWNKARKNLLNLESADISPYAGLSAGDPYSKFLNCPGDAFQNAIRTLGDRATKFGPASAMLREWISGQDDVFANCGGVERIIPTALNSGDSLLRADRDYQIAAAHFYARDFDEAAGQFEAIAKDRTSPWAEISPYLAARTLIRKANLVHKENEPFDRSTMASAQAQLESIVADPKAPIHEPAKNLLNYVRFRTEPEKRIAELDRAMLNPDLGHNFKQDLLDYALLLSRGEQAEAPSDWLQTYSALDVHSRSQAVQHQSEPAAADHSLAQWRKTKSLPWLIAALAGTIPSDPDLQLLLGAARQVPSSSPGYLTVRYYALCLMVASGQSDAARKELDTLLSRKESDIPLGSRNLLNDQRLKVTTSLEDFLQHAPETPVPADLDFNTFEETPAAAKAKPAEPVLNHYAAEVFLKRFSLSALIQAAESPTLPNRLRRDVARSAWVRSILLDDSKAATQLQAVLQDVDPALSKSMDPLRAAQSEVEKHFLAAIIILDNPGLKPSAREGLPRSETLGELDNYRDNWWCADVDSGANWNKGFSGYDRDINLRFEDHDPDFPFPNWMTDSQKAAAKSDWKKLSAAGTAPNYLVQQVLAYGKEHPQDPRVPRALYLAVRSTRFGCTNVETSDLSKAAFDFLHKQYPQSEWTAKTKYYY